MSIHNVHYFFKISTSSILKVGFRRDLFLIIFIERLINERFCDYWKIFNLEMLF